MKILNFFRQIKKSLRSPYRPSVEVLISAKNLKHNLAEYKKHYPQLQFAPVLKSNAYGHGLVPVAKILDEEKVPFLVVDSLPEAATLRQAGIRSPILIIGYVAAENIIHAKLDHVVFTITSLDQLRELGHPPAGGIKSPTTIHLKIDTGMHRQGILPEEIKPAAEIIRTNEFLNLEGICSHLADADNPDDHFTNTQIKLWSQVVGAIKKDFPTLPYFHLANTAGVLHSHQTSCNLVRLGLGLYGIDSSSSPNLNLKPVLSLKTIVSSIRSVPAGEAVGYGLTYPTQKDIRAATIPVGYFEGVDRRLSNKGVCQIAGHDCPIIGRVSMNITSLDVSSVPDIKLGDRVTVISDNPSDQNSVENIAKLCETIPWEILVHISSHLRRQVLP